MKRYIPRLVFLLSVYALNSFPVKGQMNSGIRLNFLPVFGSEELVLENKSYVTAQGDTVFIDRFVFYISSVKLFFKDGSEFKEPDSYHLIDFSREDANSFMISGAPFLEVSRIEFAIGVDSLMSVSGAYGGDLDPMYGMYWTWNTGYINAKLEGRSKSCRTRNNSFEFHIGGFQSPFTTLRMVSLPVSHGISSITLKADARSWFEQIHLDKMNSIVIPGKEASAVADNYSTMIQVK